MYRRTRVKISAKTLFIVENSRQFVGKIRLTKKATGKYPQIHKKKIPEYIYFFFFAVRLFCSPWAYCDIISGAGVVSGTPHPAV